ncbi:MAG: hypothetical protein ACOYOA_03310, partial [Saprospiraceae bacterium]
MKKTNFTFLKGIALSVFMVLGFASANAQGALACQDHINASLDAACQVNLATVVSQANGASIVIKDGNVVIAPIAGVSYGTPNVTINKIYTYEIVSGLNKCWGTIKFEDKLVPVINCPAPITVACNANVGFNTTEQEIIFSGTAGSNQILNTAYLALNAP